MQRILKTCLKTRFRTATCVLNFSSSSSSHTINRDDPDDKPHGFMKYSRQDALKRDPSVRANDWEEINDIKEQSNRAVTQSARCMECGTPFCQSATGCPIGNVIPKFNDLVYHDQWYEAFLQLVVTNNFPELTGRVCPAPCEGSCVLGINESPVSIKCIEAAIADKAWQEGWVTPSLPERRSGKTVAIVGSGPAGMAAADQLNRAGHSVVVYERNDRPGGLLTYGIPNMKLDKSVVSRRFEILEESGIDFVTNVEIGKDIMLEELISDNDAVLLTTGATTPRDIDIEGRSLDGIYYAMDYLEPVMKDLLEDGRQLAGRFAKAVPHKMEELQKCNIPNASGKKVIVVGGGDTGVDCIATALRQGAKSINSFEILDAPPETRSDENPWPLWPRIMRTDYAHSECISKQGRDPRKYSVMATRFISDNSGENVSGVETVDIDWSDGTLKRVEGSEKIHEADLVFLALGFSGPEHSVTNGIHLGVNKANNFETSRGKFFHTSIDKLYVAGDCRRGQSLVVWAIDEGRQAARSIDIDLMGQSALAVSGGVKQLKFTASLNSSKEFDGEGDGDVDPALVVQRDRLMEGIGW
eukprot:g5242.t1